MVINLTDIFKSSVQITELFDCLIETHVNKRMYTDPFFFFYYALIKIVQTDEEAEGKATIVNGCLLVNLDLRCSQVEWPLKRDI